MAESLTHGVAALNLGPNAPAAPPAKAGMFELQLERRSFFTKLGVDKNHWDALDNGLLMHAFTHHWSAERLVAEQATLADPVARIEATKTEAAVFCRARLRSSSSTTSSSLSAARPSPP